jgi:hypothetical protein
MTEFEKATRFSKKHHWKAQFKITPGCVKLCKQNDYGTMPITQIRGPGGLSSDLSLFAFDTKHSVRNRRLSIENAQMLSIKVIDEANKEDYPMHFAYNERRKSATMSLAGRHAIIDMINSFDDLLKLISMKGQVSMEGSIAEQMKARMLHGETIFVVDRQTKTLK